MAESRGSRKPNSRSFKRKMRLRPERTPVTIRYVCPICGGPHPRDSLRAHRAVTYPASKWGWQMVP